MKIKFKKKSLNLFTRPYVFSEIVKHNPFPDRIVFYALNEPSDIHVSDTCKFLAYFSI